MEFLFLTPLKRISLNLDVIIRKVLINIITAFSDQKVEDLIKEEKFDELTGEKNAKKKKNLKKKHKNKTNKKDNSDYCKEIAAEIIEKIICEIEESFILQNDNTTEKPATQPILSKNSTSVDFSKSAKTIIQVTTKPKFYRTEAQKYQNKRMNSYKYTKKSSNSTHTTPKIHTTKVQKSAKTSCEVTPTKSEKVSKFQ